MLLDTKNVDKEINKGILRSYLGIDDASDIDFDTYKLLIREKIAAARMGSSNADSGDIALLTKEFVRIKKINSSSPSKKKIDIKKLIRNVEKKQKEKSKSAQKLLSAGQFTPRTSSTQKNTVSSNQDESVKVSNLLSPSLSSLQNNMESIYGTLNKQYLLGKSKEEDSNKEEAKQKRKSREAKLEGGKSKTKDVEKKVVKPVKGLFDMLGDFFKNILLGGALSFLLNVLKDPAKMLQPFVDALNSIVEFMNGLIRAVNAFTNEFNFFVLNPINEFIIAPIHGALNFIEDRINDALALFGQEPLENIPDQAPKLEIPDIPEIPKFDPFKKEQTQGSAPPVQTFTSGGQVTNNSYNITGAGADTQLIAAQPGEIVMSTGAVQKYGANNLLAMNAAGGGTNKPKTVGSIQGFSGGGLVGGQAGSPSDAANRKIFLHWNAAQNTNPTGPYHQVFLGNGQPRSRNVNYGVDVPNHTGGYNSRSIGLGIAAMGHRGMTKDYYDEKKGWAENPPRPAQLDAMAMEAAGLAKAYGWTTANVDRNVLTHGEWERKGVKSGQLGGSVQRWDLDQIKSGPSTHPGGYFTTRQVKSKGGNYMRAKIKSFMSGMPESTEGPTQTTEVGSGPKMASFREDSTANRQLQQSTNPSFKPSTTKASPSAPAQKQTKVKVVKTPSKSVNPPQSGSKSQGKGVPNISSVDPNNNEILIVKSIYNLVG